MNCECPELSTSCCNGLGLAVIAATRNGVRLNLCTHCTFSSDTDRVLRSDLTEQEIQRVAADDPLGGVLVTLEYAARETT